MIMFFLYLLDIHDVNDLSSESSDSKTSDTYAGKTTCIQNMYGEQTYYKWKERY